MKGKKKDDDMKGEHMEEKEGAEYKRGGKAKMKHKAKHKKHGGKIEGKKPHERADKRARGGKINGMAKKVTSAAGMSPTSPLSGAGKTAEPKVPMNDREDD